MKKLIFSICIAGCVVGSCTNQTSVPQSSNPFLNEWDTPYGIPPFDKIHASHFLPAFRAGIQQQLDEIDVIVNSRRSPNFENVIVALDRSGGILRKVRPVFAGVTSANITDSLQAIDREITPELSNLSSDIYLNMALFAKVKEVYDKRETLRLNEEQMRLTEETYKRFTRSGANLSPENRERLRVLNEEISMLQLAFRDNALADLNDFQLHITNRAQLNGLPQAQILAAEAAARRAGKDEGWVFTMHNPSVMPFLQFADDRELRRVMQQAYINRGNNDNANDNKEVIATLVAKRLERAKLMGYEHFAALELEERMAKTPEAVYNFLDQIWTPALNKAKEEAANMQALINRQSQRFRLEAWDWRYYHEKVMKDMFDLDEDMLRPYFKLENVLEGIFYVCNRLWGITFTELHNLPVYHEEVRILECRDEDGTVLGLLYMDMHPHSGKRGGAWCGSFRMQSVDARGNRILPITYIVCNFTRPSGDTPALLSPDEVGTFFHEWGHAIHNLFRNVNYYGIASVERDFVELPSQIMEHWAFEPEVLREYAKHYSTGEIIPDELIEKMENSGKYGQGFATVEYLASSYFDMDFHVLTEIPANFNVVDFERASMERIGLIPEIAPRHRTTHFSHIWNGGYIAGYYSYRWAEVLDSDAFEAFKETGNIFDRATANAFRKHILEPGGIRDGMDMYVSFRGAEPGIEPMLRNRGLAE